MTRQGRRAAVAGLALVCAACGPAATTTLDGPSPAPTTTSEVPGWTGPLPLDRPSPSPSPSTAAPAPSRAAATTQAPPSSAVAVVPTGCTALPARLPSTGGGAQLVTVQAPDLTTTAATVTAWQKAGDCWTAVVGPVAAHLGTTGLVVDKREGDGGTPVGLFGIGPTMYGTSPNPGVRYAWHPISCGDWWDEDSASPTYDTFQHVACGTKPAFDGGASEALWTYPQQYAAFAEFRTNPAHVPGKGSAIFLHASTGGATAGCVSIPLAQLQTVLRWLDPAASPHVWIGTQQNQ